MAFNKQDLTHVYQLLQQGKLAPVYATMPLAQAATAHDLIESGKVVGKILLLPEPD